MSKWKEESVDNACMCFMPSKLCLLQRFKRLRRIQDEESDNEDDADQSQDRDAIAMEIFSEDVSVLYCLL